MLVASEKVLPHSEPLTACVALTGNPNCGKTTIFNALTGLRAKVGNYAGVTVERKEGKILGAPAAAQITLLDLPGTYSLSPKSLDEEISRDVLLNRLPEVPAPTLVVVIVDASNLERNLYYATQVIELGYSTLIALNMMDVAEQMGRQIDSGKLAAALGVPVVPVVARTGKGIPELRAKILELAAHRTNGAPPRCFSEFGPAFSAELQKLATLLKQETRVVASRAEALLLLTDDGFKNLPGRYSPEIIETVTGARQRLERAGEDWQMAPIEARYAQVGRIHSAISSENIAPAETLSDRLDRIVTDRFWGVLVFLGIMAAMFESIFSLAQFPMDWVQNGVLWFGQSVGRLIPPGDLHSLLIDGVIAGVGSVVVFLPQICLLFLFIGLLEDTGYMARAAFLMDRLMSKVGLHGKSFIPMLSSFACAIPGIMATRTIETPKDRLVTILVSPLMSCSARLPVYTLLIAACIPHRRVLGILNLPGLTMFAMYLLGIVVALLMAWLFKKTLLRGETPLLIMELPPYRLPVLTVVLRHMWDRSKLFLRRAGTVILGISILLWFLATYPRDVTTQQRFSESRQALQTQAARATVGEKEAISKQLTALEKDEAGERLRQSFAGRFGKTVEPLIAPLGFDWKIGIGLVASFAAREVFVSTMSTVYNVGGAETSDEGVESLAQTLRTQTRPDGTKLYTPLLGITLMVFYVFALQCMSTLAVVRRETNGWKWPLFQWAYMGGLAWGLAFLTYHAGRWLGWQ